MQVGAAPGLAEGRRWAVLGCCTYSEGGAKEIGYSVGKAWGRVQIEVD